MTSSELSKKILDTEKIIIGLSAKESSSHKDELEKLVNITKYKEELGQLKEQKIVHIEYPVEHLQFSFKYFLGTPRERIEQEMAESFANAILKNKLYESQTINSKETPELLNIIYSIYIAKPKEI